MAKKDARRAVTPSGPFSIDPADRDAPPFTWWGSGIVNSLGGCETRQPEAETLSRRPIKDAQAVGPSPSVQAEPPPKEC